MSPRINYTDKIKAQDGLPDTPPPIFDPSVSFAVNKVALEHMAQHYESLNRPDLADIHRDAIIAIEMYEWVVKIYEVFKARIWS